MSYRIGLKPKPKAEAEAESKATSSKKLDSNDIIQTLNEIAQLPTHIISNDNDTTGSNVNSDDQRILIQKELEAKQETLSSILKSKSNQTVLPLSAITIAKQILVTQQLHHVPVGLINPSNHNKAATIDKLLNQLESNLTSNSFQLHFTKSNPNKSSSNQSPNSTSSSYQKRIEQLKLNIEERNYTKLTSNIDSSSSSADDATLSSMLYASSIGLNMIVAPISIGVLMYFFAGKLFIWLFGNDNVDDSNQSLSYSKNGKLNIHGVIVGVISGVIMLFIEMILFVIRNHEMDKYLTSKKKKNRKNPFGYDEKTAKRNFYG
jgi:hypothetical protein